MHGFTYTLYFNQQDGHRAVSLTDSFTLAPVHAPEQIRTDITTESQDSHQVRASLALISFTAATSATYLNLCMLSAAVCVL